MARALLNANNDERTRIQIYNERGFTEKIPESTVVGEATEVHVIEPIDDEVIGNEEAIRMVTTD